MLRRTSSFARSPLNVWDHLLEYDWRAKKEDIKKEARLRITNGSFGAVYGDLNRLFGLSSRVILICSAANVDDSSLKNGPRELYVFEEMRGTSRSLFGALSPETSILGTNRLEELPSTRVRYLKRLMWYVSDKKSSRRAEMFRALGIDVQIVSLP